MDKLPINWSFALISLILITLTAGIIYTSYQITQNRQTTGSFAQESINDCVNGIQSVSILQNGQPLSNNAVLDDLNNLSCQIHVQGVTRADIGLVCAFQVGNQPWVIGCPNNPGDFYQEAPSGKPLTGDDVTTTFTKCTQGLLNPPPGYHSPQAGEPIQARAIRRVGTCTVDSPPIPWEQTGYYAEGTNFSLQQAALTPTPTQIPQSSTTPTPIPSTTPSIPVCSSDACSSCILNQRSDILPFYQSNGWDVSCNNQQAVVNNWCTIDVNGCNNLKNNECQSTCTAQTNCPRGNLGNLNCSLDGCINSLDLAIFIPAFGISTPQSIPQNQASPDLFEDNVSIVDSADFEILRQHYNTCLVN